MLEKLSENMRKTGMHSKLKNNNVDVFNIPRKHICKAVIIKQMNNSNQKIKHLILSKNQFKHILKQKVTVVIKPRSLVPCLLFSKEPTTLGKTVLGIH